jgi:hypothetical protein
MSELELALVHLGRQLDVPPTPELPSRVRAQLAEGPARRLWASRSRDLAIALAAALIVAVGALLAVPGTRAAILEFFHLRGVTIQHVDELPTVPLQRDFNKLFLGEKVSLDEAKRRADFDVVVLEALGDPDAIYFQEDTPPGGMVSFVYGTPEHPRALFTEFRATVREVIFKKVAAGTDIAPVRIDGREGFFLSGQPHEFGYFDRNGQFHEEIVRLAGNTLLWERGPLTLRLEADINREEALEIARAVR